MPPVAGGVYLSHNVGGLPATAKVTALFATTGLLSPALRPELPLCLTSKSVVAGTEDVSSTSS